MDLLVLEKNQGGFLGIGGLFFLYSWADIVGSGGAMPASTPTKYPQIWFGI